MHFTYAGPDTGNQNIPVPSVDSHVPPSDAALSNGWTMQVFAVPKGTAETPTSFLNSDLVGTNDPLPVVCLGSDADVRSYVAGTPTYYAMRFYGNITITTGGAYNFCTVSDDGSLFYIAGLSPSDPKRYTLLIDNDGIHGGIRVCATVQLASGVYAMKVKSDKKHSSFKSYLSCIRKE